MYNVKGQEVAMLVGEEKEAGRYEVKLDARDQRSLRRSIIVQENINLLKLWAHVHHGTRNPRIKKIDLPISVYERIETKVVRVIRRSCTFSTSDGPMEQNSATLCAEFCTWNKLGHHHASHVNAR